MGAIEMKHDLQEAISYNVKEYKGDYGSLLFFSNDDINYLKSLYFMEQLNIKIDNGKRLLYHIKLDEEMLEKFSEEELAKVRMCNFLNKLQQTFFQKLEENNLITTKTFSYEEKEVEAEKATEEQLNVMAGVKEVLENSLNMDFEIKETENFLSLEVETKEINWDKNMLRTLLEQSTLLNIVAIVPCFYNEKIVAIRIFLAINLTESEE